MRRRAKLICAFLIFGVSFVTKSLHAVDLAPVMYTPAQTFWGITHDYDRRAVSIIEGDGVLFPSNLRPGDTGLLAHAPGYSIYLGSIYAALGRSFFTVQLVQNLINSFSPVVIFMLCGSVLSWRVGVGAGLISALSHHLSFYSNLILPDSLCALPVLLAMWCLAISEKHRHSLVFAALAGLGCGLSAWLRPNGMLLGVFLALGFAIAAKNRSGLWLRCGLTAIMSLLVIAPITLRNYKIYGEFVPIQLGVGLNLWEGIGESGRERFGAVAKDEEVAQQEAEIYRNPSYAGWWASPDGIKRDRDRVSKSLDVIVNNPVWYAGVMLNRMADMIKYSAHAPLVFRASDLERRALSQAAEPTAPADRSALAAGELFSFARPLTRPLQRLTKETMLVFLLIGGFGLLLLDRRKALLMMLTPFYYFLFQSAMHTEFRYALAMHYFLFVLAAAAWLLVGASTLKTFQKLYKMRLKWRISRESA